MQDASRKYTQLEFCTSMPVHIQTNTTRAKTTQISTQNIRDMHKEKWHKRDTLEIKINRPEFSGLKNAIANHIPFHEQLDSTKIDSWSMLGRGTCPPAIIELALMQTKIITPKKNYSPIKILQNTPIAM